MHKTLRKCILGFHGDFLDVNITLLSFSGQLIGLKFVNFFYFDCIKLHFV